MTSLADEMVKSVTRNLQLSQFRTLLVKSEFLSVSLFTRFSAYFFPFLKEHSRQEKLVNRQSARHPPIYLLQTPLALNERAFLHVVASTSFIKVC